MLSNTKQQAKENLSKLIKKFEGEIAKKYILRGNILRSVK